MRTTITMFLAALLAIPAAAAAQVCIGNAAESRALTGFELGTGASIAPDMRLHMAGAVHHRDQGTMFGAPATLTSGAAVGMFPRQEGAHADQYAARGGAALVLGIGTGDAAPDALDLCISAGTAFSYFSVMDLDFTESDADRVLTYIFWTFPVAANLGYRMDFGDIALVPFIAPGLNYHIRIGFDSIDMPDDDADLFDAGLGFFTRAGVGVTWRMVTGGLTLERGLAEFGKGTRVGIGAGIRL